VLRFLGASIVVGVLLAVGVSPMGAAAAINVSAGACSSSLSVSQEAGETSIAWSAGSPVTVQASNAGTVLTITPAAGAASGEQVVALEPGYWTIRAAFLATGCSSSTSYSIQVAEWPVTVVESTPGVISADWAARSGSVEYRVVRGSDDPQWTLVTDALSVTGFRPGEQVEVQLRWTDSGGRLVTVSRPVIVSSETSVSAPLPSEPSLPSVGVPSPSADLTETPDSLPPSTPTPTPSSTSAQTEVEEPAGSAEPELSDQPTEPLSTSPDAADAVTAHPAVGLTAQLTPSAVVSETPASPATPGITLALRAAIGEQARGSSVDVTASGLKPGSTYRILVHSTPQILAEGMVGDDGTVQATVTLPSELESGSHHIVFEGEAVDGSAVQGEYGFSIDDEGILLATDDVPLLEKRGQEAAPYLWLGAAGSALLAFLVLLIVSALRARRRREKMMRAIEALEQAPLVTEARRPPTTPEPV